VFAHRIVQLSLHSTLQFTAESQSNEQESAHSAVQSLTGAQVAPQSFPQ
jgi:hypothetical protein